MFFPLHDLHLSWKGVEKIENDRFPSADGMTRFIYAIFLPSFVAQLSIQALAPPPKAFFLKTPFLFSQDGYLKLVDFGTAKRIEGRTFTLCGSPEYVAPEVLLGKGYNQAVDIWALGVLVYEMAVGFSPFNPSQDLGHLQVCSNIIQGKINFPPDFQNPELEDLIRGLLAVEPTDRLGCQAEGAADIKRHDFFRGFDWELMEARRMRAPWVPKLSGAGDASMFEDIPVYEREDNAPLPEDEHPGWDDDF